MQLVARDRIGHAVRNLMERDRRLTMAQAVEKALALYPELAPHADEFRTNMTAAMGTEE